MRRVYRTNQSLLRLLWFFFLLALIKAEVSPTKNGPEHADAGGIVLKQREDSKRSESPAVSKVGVRKESVR